uniref:NADH-ubiquinone oxidoreductase chain 4 n=2 Tax=unclassified Nephtys TaxID=2628724 RepID=B2C6Q7_9ANNE
MMKLIFPLFTLLILSLVTSASKKTWHVISMWLLILSLLSVITLYSPLLSLSNLSLWLATDMMSTPLITLTLWVAALMFYASMNIFNNNQAYSQFSMYIIILTLILLWTFSVSNILLFYISFESSLIPTLLLIIGWGYQPERMQAGMYMMIYTIAASLPLLLSILLMYHYNAHLFMFASNISMESSSLFIMKMWWFITILAFMVKMPLYMTHLWLPKAHVEAPVAGSMVLAGILLKLGSYGLLRMSSLFMKANMLMSPYISSIALWGGAITSFICIRQTDLKSLIAYSSVGHMGLLTAGVMSNTTWGWQGAMTLMIAHGLCSSALFALANMTYETTHTRSIYLTKGLLALFPALTLWWFLMAAGNMAAPPTINLLSEIILLTSSLFLSMFTSLSLAIMSFLAAAYSLFLYTSSQHGSTPTFMNSLNLTTPRNHTIILLHAVPLFILVTKSDIVTAWV